MADAKATPNWVGPVVGALILVGGYIAYQEWYEHSQADQQCAELKRMFTSNMNQMMGPAEAAMNESLKEGNQSPMASLSGSVGANQAVVDTLNAKCPGWVTKQYD